MTVELTEEGTSRYVQLKDGKLHYNEAGSGHPVILIHGSGAGATGTVEFQAENQEADEFFGHQTHDAGDTKMATFQVEGPTNVTVRLRLAQTGDGGARVAFYDVVIAQDLLGSNALYETFDRVAAMPIAGANFSAIADFADASGAYTSGELPLNESQLSALIQFVRDGGGFAGSHCAADTLYQQPAYGEMLGAYFDGHPWHQRVRIRVEDRAHPATLHLGREFEIEDEIYQFREPYDRDHLSVLLSLDTSSVDLHRPEVRRTDGDFALSWCRSFGAGRVFYTALGHRPEVWRDGRFRKHLLGGCTWAMSG